MQEEILNCSLDLNPFQRQKSLSTKSSTKNKNEIGWLLIQFVNMYEHIRFMKQTTICSLGDRLVSYGTNLSCRGRGFMVYYRQVFLPIGIAWLM